MSENRQKGKATTGKSKYAQKKALQSSGHYSSTSPFQSSRQARAELEKTEVKEGV